MVLLTMGRFLQSLLLVCLFIAGPALCFGGLVQHECDCSQSSAAKQCQHEDSCDKDPCEALAILQDKDARDLLDFELALATPLAACLDLEPDAKRWSWSLAPPLPPDRWNLPYPQSDRPLLI